jgi:DNA ligase-1
MASGSNPTSIDPIIPVFETLYKKTKRVLEWSIAIIPCDKLADKASSPPTIEAYKIETKHGEKGGNLVTHTTIVKTGKAGRTTLEQAALEATRKWTDKRDKDLYVTEGYEVESSYKEPAIRPMLAQTYIPTKITLKFPVFSQRKYDGIRCLAYKKVATNGETFEICLESRKGTPFIGFERLKEELRNLPLWDKGVYLDGELYTPDLPFETISGLVRKKGSENSEEREQIQYHIYDIYSASVSSLGFRERNDILEGILKNTRLDGRVRKVASDVVSCERDIKRLHDLYVTEGYEGIMLRCANGIYEPDKRSKNLFKYKEFMEEEFRIVGYTEGEGVEEGLVIWQCEISDGRIFGVRPRGTHQMRRKWFLNADKMVGKNLTVIFQEYTDGGIPRFPVGKAVRIDG